MGKRLSYQLTDFNGTSVTYDEIGNPLTIGSKELLWLGRPFIHIKDIHNIISYSYNGDSFGFIYYEI